MTPPDDSNKPVVAGEQGCPPIGGSLVLASPPELGWVMLSDDDR